MMLNKLGPRKAPSSPQVKQIGGKVTRKSLNLLTIVEFRIV